jgi:hypothetical protein
MKLHLWVFSHEENIKKWSISPLSSHSMIIPTVLEYIPFSWRGNHTSGWTDIQDECFHFKLHPCTTSSGVSLTNRYSYLLICCDTCWTKNLLRLARSRAAIAIAPTVLTAVHGEVVGSVKFWKTSITAKTMYHILIFNFKSNLQNKNRYKVSRNG